MELLVTLGYITVILNFLMLVFLIPVLIKYFRNKVLNTPFLILLGSILFLFPVMTFENLLFLDLYAVPTSFSYNLTSMKFMFALGILGYLTYNLHLLTIEDLPSFPVLVISIFTGFAIGTMVTSAQLDVSQTTAPIFYDPISGGILFITSLMIFNVTGFAGFLLSLFVSEWSEHKERISTIGFIAIVNFFVSPIFIFLLRIGGYNQFPFNFIFLNAEIAFCLHLGNYLSSSSKSGFPIRSDLRSLNIIDMNHDTVIAGYSLVEGEMEYNKLQGMAMIAIDTAITHMFESSQDQKNPTYVGTYGDALMIREGDFLLIAVFMGLGKKIGRFNLRWFLRNFVKCINENHPIEFIDLLERYIYPFIHKKRVVNLANFYSATPSRN